MVKISASILSADFGNLEKEIKRISKSDFIHFDVMDGNFVPDITFGYIIAEKISKITSIPLDIHLMVNNPERQIDKFANLNPEILTFHYEVYKDLHMKSSKIIENIKKIKDYGIKAGVAINPETYIPEKELENLILNTDLILIMSVHPGFAGQKFIDEVIPKIKNLRKKVNEIKNVILEIDGGINLENSKTVIDAGIDIIAIGSFLFRNENPNMIIEKIKSYNENLQI